MMDVSDGVVGSWLGVGNCCGRIDSTAIVVLP